MTWEPDYVDVSDLAAYLRIADSDDDAQLALAISAASRAVDRACNRQFGLVAAVEPRSYTPLYDKTRGRWTVRTDDLMTSVGQVVSVDGLTVTDFTRKPVNASVVTRPWTELVFGSGVTATGNEDSVTVTARWGWTEVPAPVVQATLLQASRFFTRRDSPYGIAGSPDNGSELRLLAKVDPDVAVILGSYVRVWGAV